MFKCPYCSYTTSHRNKFYSHKKHKHDDGVVAVSRLSDRKVLSLLNFEKYLLSFSQCLHCGKEYCKSHSKQKYCSHSCAATITNTGSYRSKEIRSKIAKSLLGQKREPKGGYKQALGSCVICGKDTVAKYKVRKTCSKECQSQLNSRNSANRVAKSGTTFSTQVKNFKYKHITVDCDSILETAAVIYMVDHMNADKIERFKSILCFLDCNGKTHHFNPDFFVVIKNQVYIVEVKSVWKETMSVNEYNAFFAEKKNALKNFCDEREYTHLWLDIDHDPQFKLIYRHELKNKQI